MYIPHLHADTDTDTDTLTHIKSLKEKKKVYLGSRFWSFNVEWLHLVTAFLLAEARGSPRLEMSLARDELSMFV